MLDAIGDEVITLDRKGLIELGHVAALAHVVDITEETCVSVGVQVGLSHGDRGLAPGCGPRSWHVGWIAIAECCCYCCEGDEVLLCVSSGDKRIKTCAIR